MITQGDQGEMLALGWLGLRYPVAVPLGRSPDYDVIAEIDGKLARVQVKTTRVYVKQRWLVQLSTRGGNQSWTGVAKRFSPDRCDYLYAHTACGRRWFIPSLVIEGETSICLSGPKYAEYEVDPGPPLTLS